jgi:nitrate reductase gamma subunit
VSDLLHFSEHTLQEVALAIMAIVYITRLTWLMRFKAGRERQPSTGLPGTTPRRGIIYSWANVAMPWAMESTRTKRFIYGQFVIFHLGVTAAIALSFVIPYAPRLLDIPGVVPVLQVIIGVSCLIGVLRMIRRAGNKYMRAISSPDDYFSLALLTVWFFFATLAVPNDISGGEGIMLTYFMLTAFFLIYVPFSKISHYLYYPFTRYYLGRSLGHRGSYPIKRVPARQSQKPAIS